MTTLEFICAGGIITAVSSILSLVLQRLWEKKDKKEDGKNAVMSKLAEIDEKLDKHISDNEQNNVRDCRTRILAFADELRLSVKHSEERFNGILEDVDIYERYCLDHRDYPNSKAVAAIKYIRATYENCLENNLFL